MYRPLSLAFSAILLAGSSLAAHAAGPDPKAILTAYADIGQAMYQDSVTAAETLKTAVDAFLANPNDATLKAAREAWKAARVPYMQTEVFRFGNPEIDDLEGNVNSWPLDEGLIDYVDSSYGTTSDSSGSTARWSLSHSTVMCQGRGVPFQDGVKECSEITSGARPLAAATLPIVSDTAPW